jgi:predicted DNA-binding protein (MmcQ/YjbR family)
MTSITEKQVEKYLLSKPESSLYFPFGDEVNVFRVKNKVFALLSLGKGGEKGTNGKMAGHYCLNLKCDPSEALILRDIFPSVIPGYHMSKANWNTVILDGSIPKGELERMMDNSFLLVVNKMTKREQKSILLHL